MEVLKSSKFCNFYPQSYFLMVEKLLPVQVVTSQATNEFWDLCHYTVWAQKIFCFLESFSSKLEAV